MVQKSKVNFAALSVLKLFVFFLSGLNSIISMYVFAKGAKEITASSNDNASKKIKECDIH